MKPTKVFYTLLILILSCLKVFGQSGKIELIQAGSLEGGEKNGAKYNRLLGNVQLKQKETLLYCDSAHLYRDRNYAEIFSNVRVVQGSVTITSATATYDGEQRKAVFLGGVILRDEKMTVNTPSLAYNMNTRIGRYTEGGTILETENRLTSQFGNYNAGTKMLSFKGNVHLVGSEADIQSDTLQYNTISKVVYFVAPTRIQNEQGLLTAKGGYYNTLNKQSVFRGSQVETADYYVTGDNVFFDRIKNYLHASGNVRMTSKDQKNKVIITGQEVHHWKSLGRSKVFGSPVMRSLVSGDTLYVAADTLVSVDSNDPKKKDFLYAYNDVKIYKTDLQGKCDSLTYNLTDSVMFMNYDPILWNANSQMVGERVEMRMKNKALDRMFLYNNAFIISEDTLSNLNQIKGRNITAFFEKGDIRRADVNGNGESIYFALEGDTLMTGMNKTICSDMLLKFKDKKLQTISFLTNPDANFIPPHELKEPDKRLPGFKWRIAEKPTKKEVLARRNKKSAKPRKTPVVSKAAKTPDRRARTTAKDRKSNK
ncbi:OstA-like protein [Adhaeribacter aquaticus]|uniref:OstA-like protein n=1 Tax=Adhaeribacter aquaticus TaxID=299567 RepID=UPI0004241810|nr:OstA-like protein [Adhaeribacter aquaticus]